MSTCERSRSPRRGGEQHLQQQKPQAYGPEEVTLREKEIAFWKYFKDRVSEWNPCFGEDGEPRFFWDEEIGAHDIEVDVGAGAGLGGAEPRLPSVVSR